jgi:hypothetical protein
VIGEVKFKCVEKEEVYEQVDAVWCMKGKITPTWTDVTFIQQRIRDAEAYNLIWDEMRRRFATKRNPTTRMKDIWKDYETKEVNVPLLAAITGSDLCADMMLYWPCIEANTSSQLDWRTCVPILPKSVAPSQYDEVVDGDTNRDKILSLGAHCLRVCS